ncbi:hypothetical protein H0H87_003033 [Tephrocybe sp. NHM501043]|nr:hypothetical protein H0H87_003033 [Tephrocybe sp. NHM501043]
MLSTLTTFDDTTTIPTDRSFPQEIFDNIIDYTYDHKITLSICSTVCKSWLPRCRSHLFSEINLDPKLVEFLYSSPHALQTVAPYIKDAALGGAWSLAQKSEYDQVISLLLSLDGVRSLTIETWSWDFISPVSKCLILDADGVIFQNITRLRLQYFRFPSFSVLATAISGFAGLEDLSFDNVTWDDLSDNPSDPVAVDAIYSSPRHLKRLHIRSSLVKPLIAWLFGGVDSMDQQGVTPRAHSLILPELLPSDIYLIGRLLRSLGSCLRHLEIGFIVHNYENPDMQSRQFPRYYSTSAKEFYEDLSTEIDFIHNQDLRTLRIHHLTLYQFPSHNATTHHDRLVSPVFWLVPLLSNVSSSLAELSLSMWLSQEAHLDLIDWPALSSVLAQPLLNGLRLVQFHVFGLEEGRDDLIGWLHTRLEEWQAFRDIVQVIFL